MTGWDGDEEGCSAGFPRRITGRFGSFSSLPELAAAVADEDGVLLAVAGCDAAVEDGVGDSCAGFFRVGRSGSLFPDPAVDDSPLPEAGVGALLGVGPADVELEEPPDPGRRKVGRSSSEPSEGFGFDCFEACWAILASMGDSAFQCPSATQFPLTCLGVVTVKSPVGSP